MSLSCSRAAGFYLHAVTGLLGRPGEFFNALPRNSGWKKPWGFLLVSGLFFVASTLLTTLPERPLLCGGIYLVNAVGMALVSAAIGYGVMFILFGKPVPVVRFFSVYAFATGVTLLAAWIPFFFCLTEPWKWFLIGKGMTKGLGFTRPKAVAIILISLGVVVLLFWSVWSVSMPVA